MRCVLCLIILIYSVLCNATTCKKVLSIDEADSQRTYRIQKDANGYMWFVTYSGINRYDGKNLKQYELLVHGKSLNKSIEKSKLYIGHDKKLWLTTVSGYVFLFNQLYDRYELVKDFRAFQSGDFNSLCIDNQNNIWFSNQTGLFVYSTSKNTMHVLTNRFTHISALVAAAPGKFFLACKQGLFMVSMDNYALSQVSEEISNKQCVNVRELLYHSKSSKLFISDLDHGVCIYDSNKKQFTHSLQSPLTDVVSRLKVLNEREILIATDGMGLSRMNVWDYRMEPYSCAYSENGQLVHSNRVLDAFIDEQKRIWVADYLAGVTLISPANTACKWYTHRIGDEQSLGNNQVNAVLKDSDGDIWFATDDGVCYYQPQTGRWTQLPLLTSRSDFSNGLYTSLCEVTPGEIWVGNYARGIFVIDKHSGKIDPPKESQSGVQLIRKDSRGKVWSVRRDLLVRTDVEGRHEQIYRNLPYIHAIAEKDTGQMWIGSESGLFILHLKSGSLEAVKLPVKHAYIHALYQKPGGMLYIGTGENGLLIYDLQSKTASVSDVTDVESQTDHIHNILPDNEGNLFLSTDRRLACFNMAEKRLYHFSNDPLLEHKTQFMPASAAYMGDGKFMFGTSAGAVEFNKSHYSSGYSKCSRIFFDELKVLGHSVVPGKKNSPFEYAINNMSTLYLDYNQNLFSFKAFSINYDCLPSVAYTWRLNDGAWSEPSGNTTVNYSNLQPGRYLFSARALSTENGHPIAQRSLWIVVSPPLLKSKVALFIYGIIVLTLVLVGIRGLFIWEERNLSREKIRLFMDTALNICMPLALIKEPLEAMYTKSESEPFKKDFQIILQQLKGIDHFFSRLVNIERIAVADGRLKLIEIELNAHVGSLIEHFQSYAKKKNVRLVRRGDCELTSVWLDGEKMELAMKGVLSNIIDKTSAGGQVEIVACCSVHSWSIDIISTNGDDPKGGLNDPSSGNSYSADGLSWSLIRKLVGYHKGKLQYDHKPSGEISIKLTFPITIRQSSTFSNWFLKAKKVPRQLLSIGQVLGEDRVAEYHVTPSGLSEIDKKRYSILLIEERDDLRTYLQRVLADDYIITVLSEGENALEVVRQKSPDLVLSAAILAGVSGYELCVQLKADEMISHIPVILFVEPGNESDFLKKLYNAADLYLTIPFPISMLRAEIDTLIVNREIIKKKYIKLALEADGLDEEAELPVGDAEFIAKVRQTIEVCLSTPEFNVDILCAQMNMSRSGFYARMKSTVNQAPADYIRTVRMSKALRLLLAKKHTVVEVSELTGFSDTKYFREVFKKYYGASPLKYINSL